ncbi:thioredoxin-like protein 1 [Coccinella septempunctata]|uniref:thioredoxin-like protein 1 n=1 Tax=Coccinella septempunctata TaxID=41139 RepID=UPI001D085114|nr:thioredoxin-like protein 1 [Coccinella septempunctata]
MSLVKVINDEAHFQTELSAASTKLVVADFTASWCGPCQRIAPVFQQLSVKYPNAVFLKIDVDKCQETAAAQGVSAMPTFIFYRNKAKVDRVQGADAAALENKIQQYYGSSESEETESVSGYLDLYPFITKAQCECLNESDDHTLEHCLTSGKGFLQSDCDEQLIISIAFNQAVKIHSIKVKAPAGKGPKNLRLFINQPRTLDFDQMSSFVSVQDLEIKPEELDGTPVNLKFVKFQNVQNIQVFIKDNQEGGEVTQIDHLAFIGTPISTTNMGDFKRVAGKKGESH